MTAAAPDGPALPRTAQVGPPPSDALFEPHTAIAHLAGLGLVDAGTARAHELGGGISNVVLAVEDQAHRLVLKQSLPRLRVADEWLAPRDRVLAEADALQLAGRIVPGSVPELVLRDPERHAIVLQHAPADWVDWKCQLLAGQVDSAVAGRLGEVLGAWHSHTLGGADVPARFEDGLAFELLRVDPYYRTTASRAPEVADAVLDMAARMTARRTCLVHGDLSPKNVLTGPGPGGAVWVIDFEVAHLGDPAFDLAFLLSHLLLKSLHLPEHRSAYDRCATAFTDAYAGTVVPALRPDWGYVSRHVACLLLARVRGKSPVEYLTPAQEDMAWRLGTALLRSAHEGGEWRPCDLGRSRDEVLS